MAKGFDFGTMFLVSARKDKDGKTVINAERNCFLGVNTEFEDMLGSSEFSYIKDVEDGEEKFFVCGTDSLRLANLLQTNDSHGERKSPLRRPMANMVINSRTDKRAVKMLKYLAQAVIGPPKEKNEIAVVSIPANPLSGEFDNVFHSNMCKSFIEELGYEVHTINEARAVCYSSNPTTKDENGVVLNMTGIGISFGSGGANSCLVFKSSETSSFSIDKCGDWIDKHVASVCNKTTSEVTVYKEKVSKEGKLDLSVPFCDDDVINALCIYYKNMIDMVVRSFKDEFIKNGTQFSYPLEVIISGGSSKPKGFDIMVEKAIKEAHWPFEIKGVRRASDPLSATAVGCLTAAISREKKLKKTEEKPEENENNEE